MRLLTVVGARPQFVKAAAMSRAVRSAMLRGARVEDVLVHTGQHYDDQLSGAFFAELGLPRPAHSLQIGSGTHGWQTGRMLEALDGIIDQESPDIVVVYGDTNSTLAGALAAAKLAIPVAHVEAGLRSGRREMPEELNRVVTDHVSTLRFCPSRLAVQNLEAEGLTEGNALVGDVMLDVLREQPIDPAIATRFGVRPGAYALATIHRAGNTDDLGRLDSAIEALGCVARHLPVLFPVHPRAKAALGERPMPPGLVVLEPQPYGVMLSLVASARVVLTDSGGLQKECYWLETPCVTLREETEWPETVTDGWNVVAGIDAEHVVAAALRPRPAVPPMPVYGVVGAAGRILEELLTWHDGRQT